jgi:hypothetical protein
MIGQLFSAKVLPFAGINFSSIRSGIDRPGHHPARNRIEEASNLANLGMPDQ